MVNINIHDLKANLSAYARRVRAGETIIVCDRNKPFAELRPLAVPDQPRPAPGMFRDDIGDTADFFFGDVELAAEMLEMPVEPTVRPKRSRRT